MLMVACSSSAPPPSSTAEDFYNQGLARLEGSRVFFFFETVDYERAIASFQEVIDNFPFSEFAPLAELEIGDAYLALGRFEQAASFYQDFIELHPSHPKVPYALLRNGRCAFDQMLAPDQDQSKTREAIEQLTALIDRYPASELIDEATDLRRQASDRLALYEVSIGDYYYDAEKWTAALSRYRQAIEGAPQHPGHERTRARIGLALLRTGDAAAGKRVLEELAKQPLDDELREEIADVIGAEAARVESGFSLWPFGRRSSALEEQSPPADASSDRDLPLEALVERDPTPPPAESVPVEETGSSWLGWLWPFGGGQDDEAADDAVEPVPVALTEPGARDDAGAVEPASRAASDAPQADAAEASRGWLGWLWPFGD
jgi:outer membrane protein assembly factor BamD